VNRVRQVDPAQATGKSRELFDLVRDECGSVPNLVRVLGNSPAALEGYLDFNRALATGVLGARVREQIALAVAEINYSSYSLSAHTYLGGRVGLTEREIVDARRVSATDGHSAGILNLARAIAVQRGVLSAGDLKAARSANLTDAEIVECVSNVALNVLTNYLNHVAQTVVDYPEVTPGPGDPRKTARPQAENASRVSLGSLTTTNKERENDQMKSILGPLAVVALLSATSTASAAELVNVSGASKAAVNGYDTVAFFTDSKPVNGSPFIAAEYQGATYFFATEEHKKLFTASPAKYAPQFGGFCAFGVAIGKLFPVDISTWQVRDGRLYLNLNADILTKFNADLPGNIAKANTNWPGLVAANGR